MCRSYEVTVYTSIVVLSWTWRADINIMQLIIRSVLNLHIVTYNYELKIKKHAKITCINVIVERYLHNNVYAYLN